MRTSFKKVLYVFLFILVVVAVSYRSFGTGSSSRVLASGTALYGYAWSSNIGWINFSGSWLNPVTMDALGNLTGYAWSSSIGWIQFGGLSGWPIATGTTAGNAAVNLTTGAVTGWARACGGTAPGDCSSMSERTDGWDGWISLSHQGSVGINYGVQYNSSTGNFSGYAWGADNLGWMSWNATGTTTVTTNPTAFNPPLVTLTINNSTSPSPVAAGTPVTLAWSATNMTTGNTCSLSSTASATQSGLASSSSETPTIGQPTTFSMTCTNAIGSASNNVSISTTTTSGGGSGSVTMWLDNSTANPPQTSIHIHPSGTVTLNWNETPFYTQYSADGVTCSGLGTGPTNAGWIGNTALSYYAPNNSSSAVVLSGLSVGTYSLQVECQDNLHPAITSTTNSVSIVVTNSTIREQ